jgi:hypothetical protein
MKRSVAAIFGLLLLAAPAAAEVRSVRICAAKTLNAGTTTDCDYTDISKFKFFSWQASCAETTGSDMSVSFDWVAGSAASSSYLGIPLNTSGSAMSQLRSAWTTETTWTTLQSLQPPVAPVGTIRITEGNSDADIVCDVILNMGD